jgi:uncharacterized protein (DUF2461 family)
MSFSGFSQEIVGFLTDLKSNNHKAWFDANRSRADKLAIAPSVELVAILSGPISQMTPSLKVVPKINGSIRRIHRDTRFSKRQSALSRPPAWSSGQASIPTAQPGVHVVLADDHFGFGAGHWAFDDAALQCYRAQVRADGGEAVAAAIEAVHPLGVELGEPLWRGCPQDWTRRRPARIGYKGLVVKASKRTLPAGDLRPRRSRPYRGSLRRPCAAQPLSGGACLLVKRIGGKTRAQSRAENRPSLCTTRVEQAYWPWRALVFYQRQASSLLLSQQQPW